MFRHRKLVNGKLKHPENPDIWQKYMQFDVDKILTDIKDHQFAADLMQDLTNEDDFLTQNICVFMKVDSRKFN